MERRPSRLSSIAPLLGILFGGLLLGGGVRLLPDAEAAEAAVTLDGRLDEASWTRGLALDVEPFEALAGDGDAVTPRVVLSVADGRLWIGVAAAQAPGPGMGFSALIAGDGAAVAADGVAVAFAPQDIRSPRYVARGPRGVGRAIYRLEAVADVTSRDRWSVEAGVPLADLDLPVGTTALRVAVAVRSRRPEIVAWAPPAAAFAGPTTWARVEIPAGAATTEAALPAAEALAREDARDVERLDAWRLYLAASGRTAEQMAQARGYENALDPELTSDVLLDAVAKPLIEPLDRILELRPDLAIAQVLRGDVWRQLGQPTAALEAYAAAERIVPGLPEASFGAWVQTRGPSFVQGRAGEATDYVAAREALAATAVPDGDSVAAHGLAYARALLDLAQGGEHLARAAEALAPLKARYGFDQLVAFSAERASKAVQDWGAERQRRRQDAERDDLPRVRLETDRGPILLELFEDDVPNTVFQFVHLVRRGTYDGATIQTTIPFFAALAALDRDPGYTIPTERGGAVQSRGAFRGVVGFLGTGRDSEAAAFFLTTGTATNLEDEYVVFGRIVEGQAAADALRKGDAIRRAEVVRQRPGSTYRPVDAQGQLAPDGE